MATVPPVVVPTTTTTTTTTTSTTTEPPRLVPPTERNVAAAEVIRSVDYLRAYISGHNIEQIPLDYRNLFEGLAEDDAERPFDPYKAYLFRINETVGEIGTTSDTRGLLHAAALRTLNMLGTSRITQRQVRLLREVDTSDASKEAEHFAGIILRPFVAHPDKDSGIKSRQDWMFYLQDLFKQSTGDGDLVLASLVAYAIFRRLERARMAGVIFIPITEDNDPDPGFGPDPTPDHAHLTTNVTRLFHSLHLVDIQRMNGRAMPDVKKLELDQMYSDIGRGVQELSESIDETDNLSAVRRGLTVRRVHDGMFGVLPENPMKLQRFLGLLRKTALPGLTD